MKMTKNAFYIIFRILVSCFTAGSLVLFFSLLAGEDLIHYKDEVSKIAGLYELIGLKLNGDIDQQVQGLGEVPQNNPFKKFYCIELAKEIQQTYRLIRKEKIMADLYNAQTFQNQLKQVMDFAESSNVARLMDELGSVKMELANSADSLTKQRIQIERQRNIYLVLFFLLWAVLYLYFSRGIHFRTQRRFEA